MKDTEKGEEPKVMVQVGEEQVWAGARVMAMERKGWARL